MEFSNPWIEKFEELDRFKADVKRLVKRADDELNTGLVLLPLEDLLANLKITLGESKPVRYEKTWRDGCKCFEECGDGIK